MAEKWTACATPGPELVAEIVGKEVTLTMRFASHYEAIEFYDKCVQSCRAGNFTLELGVKTNGR